LKVLLCIKKQLRVLGIPRTEADPGVPDFPCLNLQKTQIISGFNAYR